MLQMLAGFRRYTSWLSSRFRALGRKLMTVRQARGALLRKTHGGGRDTLFIVAEIDAFYDRQRRHTGEDVGKMLDAVDTRLRKSLLRRDVVKRLGSGQFALILKTRHCRSDEEALDIAGQVQKLFACHISAGQIQAYVSASIGCVRGNSHDLRTDADLLDAARLAQLEAAAESPGGLRVYLPEMGQRRRLQQRLEQDARDAMTTGDIQAFFQPQVSLNTRRVSGFEVLARWQHAKEGLISPADFLPILENAGLMRSLGQLMLSHALQALTVWDAQLLDVPQISVNFSAEELRHPDIVTDIQKQLNDHDIAPQRLVIEVLETVHVGHANDPIVGNLSRLAKMGCHIDLDDFGTGHASLKSVRDFGANRIKIDRSYVCRVDQATEQQQILSTILSIARNLKVDSLAEGVETQAEYDYLAAAGCGHAQGYAIARPLPAAETQQWIAAHQTNLGATPAPQRLH